MNSYRGRIAPTPTGFLHKGHAKTFKTAENRAKSKNGTLILRIEDIDHQRCKDQYTDAILKDLQWVGIEWQEGPDHGGQFTPYHQSQRIPHFLKTWETLRKKGFIYPCQLSRKDILNASGKKTSNGEILFPNSLRSKDNSNIKSPDSYNWRFNVPENRTIEFIDLNYGKCSYTTGIDFGDFMIWNRDNIPSYELAVVTDDIAMKITEVVRGADLLISTARQILIYEALNQPVPAFYHCDLVTNEHGEKLAKQAKSESLSELS